MDYYYYNNNNNHNNNNNDGLVLCVHCRWFVLPELACYGHCHGFDVLELDPISDADFIFIGLLRVYWIPF